jgi:hypothetical protein
VELNSVGKEFLSDLFRRFDKDEDGALSRSELEFLFETSPGIPWNPSDFLTSTQVDEKGNLTLTGFLALWALTTRQVPLLLLVSSPPSRYPSFCFFLIPYFSLLFFPGLHDHTQVFGVFRFRWRKWSFSLFSSFFHSFEEKDTF